MILCIGTTPAVQRVMVFERLTLDRVNRAGTTVETIAGKSVNVAKVLKILGQAPFTLGFAGGDRGALIRSELARRDIGCQFIEVAPQTRLCTTVIDQKAGTITELVEESRQVPGAAYERLLEAIRTHSPGSEALVMSGTITPGGPVDLYRECCELAHECRAFSVVDGQGPLLVQSLQARPGLVKPNRAELARTLGRDLPDEASVISGIRELCSAGARRVVVTAGREPVLATDNQKTWRVIGPKIKAANPIGSGDAFTAGLVTILSKGGDMAEALRWASAAGAANAMSFLPGELARQDVESLLADVQIELIRA